MSFEKKNGGWLYIAFNGLRDVFVNVTKSVKTKSFLQNIENWQGYNNNLFFLLQKSDGNVWFSQREVYEKKSRNKILINW